MATAKLGVSITDLRGKVGHMVFSRNASGHTVRSWNYPKRQATAQQVGKRAWMANLRHIWGTLTQLQIDAWNALAETPPEVDHNRVGEVVLLSGSAWHTRINLRRLQAGQDIANDAPAAVAVDPPAYFDLAVYDFANEVDDSSFDYTDNDFDGFYAILEVAPVNSLAKQSQRFGYKTVFAGSVPSLGPQIINTELRTAFGVIAYGQRCFAHLYKQSLDGIRSTPLDLFTDVVE